MLANASPSGLRWGLFVFIVGRGLRQKSCWPPGLGWPAHCAQVSELLHLATPGTPTSTPGTPGTPGLGWPAQLSGLLQLATPGTSGTTPTPAKTSTPGTQYINGKWYNVSYIYV